MAFNAEAVRSSLVEKSVSARFNTFFVGGLAAAIVGLGLFVLALSGSDHHRAWHAFQVNWIFWTGLCCGSMVFTAVFYLSGAKWSGVIIRLAEATSFFIPVSLIGLLLIMTIGYDDIYGNMVAALGGVSAGKARWLSHSWMFIRMFLALGVLFALGIRMITCNLLPDLEMVKAK